MQKARQQLVVQVTNSHLVDIRLQEIEYFSYFLDSFSIQTSSIVSFVIRLLVFVDARAASCGVGWMYVFWLSCVVSIVAAVQVMVSASFIKVFGQALALRGPVGSVARAAEGMLDEQRLLLIAFFISVLTFILASVGMYWIRMSELGAIICSVLTFIVATFSYLACLRIYNRFYFDPDFNQRNYMSNKRDSQVEHVTAGFAMTHLPVLFEGNVLSNIRKLGALGSAYKSRYAVIRGSFLFIYYDQRAFQRSPQTPLRRRPTDLEGLRLQVDSESSPIRLLLIPLERDDERKTLELRVHTSTEAAAWIDALNSTLRSANEGLILSSSSSSTSQSSSLSAQQLQQQQPPQPQSRLSESAVDMLSTGKSGKRQSVMSSTTLNSAFGRKAVKEIGGIKKSGDEDL